MGLFDSLFGPKRFLKRLPDRVWYSRADMQREFPTVFAAPAGKRALTIVVTHFQSIIEELRTVLRERVNVQEVVELSDWAAAIKPTPECPDPIVLVRGDMLQRVGASMLPEGLDYVRIIVYTRHFLAEYDTEIETFGEGFGAPGEIGFHVSLDDELLRPFVTESLRNLLKSASPDGGPWLESSMISRSLQKAQQKLGKDVVSQRSADSPQQWLEKNVLK